MATLSPPPRPLEEGSGQKKKFGVFLVKNVFWATWEQPPFLPLATTMVPNPQYIRILLATIQYTIATGKLLSARV